MLRLVRTYKKTSIFIVLLTALATYIGRLAYRYRAELRLVYQMSRSGLAQQEEDPQVQQLRSIQPAWTPQRFGTVQALRKQLRGAVSPQREELWDSLKVEIITQALFNLYMAEVYNMGVLLSSCLALKAGPRGTELHTRTVQILDELLTNLKQSEVVEHELRGCVQRCTQE